MLSIHKLENVQRHTFCQRQKSLFKIVAFHKCIYCFEIAPATSPATSAATSVHLTKWKFLAAKQQVDERRLIPGNEAQTELNKYFIEIRNSPMC